MYELCKKNTQFKWSYECNKAFELIKKELVSDKVLTHYCLDKPLRLSCDASFYGIGACLSHVESDGNERPVCYISRVLNKTEQNYSITHKELSVVRMQLILSLFL